jgi:hypothetical protein
VSDSENLPKPDTGWSTCLRGAARQLVFDKPNDVVARLCDWRTRRMRMARDLGSECGVENRMSETASVIRPAMGIAIGLQLGSRRALVLTRFVATLMMCLLVASTAASAAVLSIVQESAAAAFSTEAADA